MCGRDGNRAVVSMHRVILIVLASLAMSASSAFAQQQPGGAGGIPNAGGQMGGGIVRQQFGDWSELCQAETGPGADRCIMVQNIESASRPGFGLAAVIRRVPAEPEPATTMHIYVPLGVYLPKGLGLQIDQQPIGNTPFWSCIPFQCEARVDLPKDLIDRLIAGDRALFAVYETPTKGTVLPISLRGFAEGFRALTPFEPGPLASPSN